MTAAVALEIPDWETRERARLDAKRCPDPDCLALPPNHRAGCPLIPMPDPDAPGCPRCEYPAGSLGCRLAHGGAS